VQDAPLVGDGNPPPVPRNVTSISSDVGDCAETRNQADGQSEFCTTFATDFRPVDAAHNFYYTLSSDVGLRVDTENLARK